MIRFVAVGCSAGEATQAWIDAALAGGPGAAKIAAHGLGSGDAGGGVPEIVVLASRVARTGDAAAKRARDKPAAPLRCDEAPLIKNPKRRLR